MTTFPNGTWALDPSATTLEVTVKKLGFITVVGTLEIESGSIEIVDGAVASVGVAAKSDSYSTGNPKRDEHVRSADFLDAGAHPAIEFSASGAEAKGASYRLAGTTKVKGASAPLSLDVSGLSVDGEQATFKAAGSVDRTAIGVDKLPGFVINNNLELSISATATLATN